MKEKEPLMCFEPGYVQKLRQKSKLEADEPCDYVFGFQKRLEQQLLTKVTKKIAETTRFGRIMAEKMLE